MSTAVNINKPSYTDQQFNELLETLLKLRDDIITSNNNAINLINCSISYIIRLYADTKLNK